MIRDVTVVRLRHRAAQVATFAKRKGDRHVDAFPPNEPIQSLVQAAEWPFPELVGVSTMPILHADGTFFEAPGFDPDSGMYHVPVRGLPRIPTTPTEEELAAAVECLDDVFADFPFEDRSSRANAFGLSLTPSVRPLLPVPAPLALIDAPQGGTGKGLFVKVEATITCGHEPAMMAMPEREEEFAKTLTSLLHSAQQWIVLDNLTKRLRSPNLAAALTSNFYQARILGVTKTPRVRNQATYVATGNQLAVGGDMGRRCFRIGLNTRAPTRIDAPASVMTHSCSGSSRNAPGS